jgi:hypothetical protein
MSNYLKKDVKYLEEDVDDNIDDEQPHPINKPLNINLPNEALKINKIS